MYAQYYDAAGVRHNLNIIGDNSELGMARMKNKILKMGYKNISIVPFIFKG